MAHEHTMTDDEMIDFHNRQTPLFPKNNPLIPVKDSPDWTFRMQTAVLRTVLRHLLNTAELNQDDMEPHTCEQIARCHRVLDKVYRSNQTKEIK